jgi:VWFA-related protein
MGTPFARSQRRTSIGLIVAICGFFLTFNAAQAQSSQQSAPSQPEQNQNQNNQKNQQEPIDTFRVDVSVVNIFFNVKDKHGALLPNLKKEDFQIFEDGQPQKIKYFAADSNLPLTLGILIDTSGSQQRVLPMEQEIGGEFLREVLREKDLAFAINFDVNIELLQDFTSSARELSRALNKVRINTGGANTGVPGMGGGPIPNSHPRGTALYDAIFLASDEKLKSEVGRKAMIVLTDGEDVGSKLKIQDAIEAAQRADSICYVLLIADRGFYGGTGYSGDREMRKLAEETGGRVIDVGARADKLKEAFDQIASELRSQYNIGYSPINQKHDGKFRQVEIRTKSGKVQSRKGYYAPKS